MTDLAAIQARLDALPQHSLDSWTTSILFAIDPDLLGDPRFAPMRDMIGHAAPDIHTLLKRIGELETRLAAARRLLDQVPPDVLFGEHDPQVCPWCKGKGRIRGQVLNKCPNCGGSGTVPSDQEGDS